MITNIKKIFTLITLTSITLVGCSTSDLETKTEETAQLSTSYKIEKVPDWDASSITPLIEAGWNVQENKNMQQIKEGFQEPVNYYATNENGKCNISYFTFANLTDGKLKTDDQYATYANPNVKNIVDNPSVQISLMGNTDSIKDKTTNKNIQILTISYTQEATDGIHKTENTVKGLRTFSTPTPNPYLTLSQENPDALINPTIEITYTCKDQQLDKTLWESILTNAEIKS